MALKIKCNYTKTSNIRYPYSVKTHCWKFQFSNKRDAEKFCKQRTKDLNNLYISVLDGYTDAVLLVMQRSSRNLDLTRALEQIQYFIEHPDYREDVARTERVCACAISSLVYIYRNTMYCKRLEKQWEKMYQVYFSNLAKPFCQGSVFITKCC